MSMYGARMVAVAVWFSVAAAACEAGLQPPGGGALYGGYELAGEPPGDCMHLYDGYEVPGPEEVPRRPAVDVQEQLGEEALEVALAGARGAERLVVCAGPAACPAVAWRRRWALVRASCLSGQDTEDLRVVPAPAHDQRPCDALRLECPRARRVVWVSQARRDVALLRLSRAVPTEPLHNETSVYGSLQRIGYWMKQIDADILDTGSHDVLHFTAATWSALLIKAVLPAVSLFMLFLYVTFGTGAPIKVPYSTEKEGITTPWMVHGYSSDVKCFPTYGQV